MTSRETRLLVTANLAVKAVALAALAAFLVAAATGTSFARHVGHAALATAHGAAAVSADSNVRTGAGVRAAHQLRTSHESDAQHLVHRFGGCIAVLGAVPPIQAPSGTPATTSTPVEDSASRAVVGPAWVPPAPSPPTSSPALRT